MSKFQVGDKVIYKDFNDNDFGESVGVVINPDYYNRGNFCIIIVVVDWKEGRGAKFQRNVGRYCRHYEHSLELVESALSNIPEPNDSDLI